MTAAADEGSVDRYRRVDSPAWLDGNVAVHEVIGDESTTAQVIPLALTTALVEDAEAHGATLRHRGRGRAAPRRGRAAR